jgi:hypothetical protein
MISPSLVYSISPGSVDCALMRAAVHQAEIFTLDVEDCDRPSVDLQKFSRAGWKLIDRGNHMPRHQLIPYSFFALPR